MRDLIGFLCLIFVCITAYGVVSRAIFMYDQMRFTALSIFTEVFYRPYWFLYSIIEEETAALDGSLLFRTDQLITKDLNVCL